MNEANASLAAAGLHNDDHPTLARAHIPVSNSNNTRRGDKVALMCMSMDRMNGPPVLCSSHLQLPSQSLAKGHDDNALTAR